MNDLDNNTTPQPRRASAGDVSTKHIRSETLFGDRREIVIDHAGREYVLRITQNGKLILTA